MNKVACCLIVLIAVTTELFVVGCGQKDQDSNRTAGSEARLATQSETKQIPPFSETLLSIYRKDMNGGFSHRWAAYVIEPPDEEAASDSEKSTTEPEHIDEEEKIGNEEDLFVEVNGERLGPYTQIGGSFGRFEVSPDGEHIAFAARKKDSRWYVVLDGKERWSYQNLRHEWYGWSPTLEGGSYIPQTQAPVMVFSSDGKSIAYMASADDKHWAVHVNGVPGPAFEGMATSLTFVAGKPTYTGFRADKPFKIQGNVLLGPYESSFASKVSADRNHWCAVVKKEGRSFLISDGQEQELLGDPTAWGIGPSGELAYAVRSTGATTVHWRGRQFSDPYDEVQRLAISPDGKHLAFWGRKGEKWSVVTDTGTFPGYDGYYFYRCGSEEYCLLWGPDSKNLAYFARKDGVVLLALNGMEMPKDLGKLPGISFSNYVDEKGRTVGTGLMQGPQFDRQAFVKALLLRSTIKCAPYLTSYIQGQLAYLEEGADESYMIVGTRRESPYSAIKSVIVSSEHGKHYAYIVNTAEGQQVILDGKIQPHVYEAIWRLRFVGSKKCAHVGLKGGKLVGVEYSVP